MNLLLTIATFFAVSASASAVKRCPNVCGEQVYAPICGHDARMGYFTFCSERALDFCNAAKKRNFTKIADGPCYPSVRDWSSKAENGDKPNVSRLT